MSPDEQEDVEVLRLALALHSYNALQAAQAANGGVAPSVAPSLVSAVLPPAAVTPRGQMGLAAIKVPGGLAPKIRCTGVCLGV